MDAAPSPVGVAAASSAPPQWPAESRWIAPPSDLSVRLPSDPAPAWPRPAQGAAVLLLLLALALLGWHTWTAQRGSCRPATLEADALASAAFDLNQADHAQLLQLPNVGEKLANDIEAYRAAHHGFRSVDELGQVRGIGPKTLAKIRPFVYVEAAASDEEGQADPLPVRPAAQVAKQQPLAISKNKAARTELVDVNHATEAELRSLPGIGATLSQRIIETRARQPFRSLEDLRRVRGIGPRKLEGLRPRVAIVP